VIVVIKRDVSYEPSYSYVKVKLFQSQFTTSIVIICHDCISKV